MAARRSRNRRRLSSNNTGLNENTNIYDDDDPLWYNRTVVRPSTSILISEHAKSTLDANSTVNASQISDGWFNKLSLSNSSHLIQEVSKQNIVNSQDNEDRRTFVEPLTESESDQDKKKRTRFRLKHKSFDKTDKSNIFLKALENTTDSNTKNLTCVQNSEVNESESTNDDSKTMKRLRPTIFKSNKKSKRELSDFDHFLEKDTSESIRDKVTNLRSSLLKNSQDNSNNISNFEGSLHHNKIDSKNLNNNNHLLNKVSTKIAQNLSPTKISSNNSSTEQNKSKIHSKTSSKFGNQKNESLLSASTDLNNSNVENIQKTRSTLFSQDQNNKYNQSIFNDVFETNESQSTNHDKLNKNSNAESNKSQKKSIEHISQLGKNISKNFSSSQNHSTINNMNKSAVNRSNTSNLSKINVHVQNKEKCINSSGSQNSTQSKLQIVTSEKSLSNACMLKSSFTENTIFQDHEITDKQETNNSEIEVDIESENSSIPVNIRRTKSRSIFLDRIQESDNENISKKSNHPKKNDRNNKSSQSLSEALNNNSKKTSVKELKDPQIVLQRISMEQINVSILSNNSNKSKKNNTKPKQFQQQSLMKSTNIPKNRSLETDTSFVNSSSSIINNKSSKNKSKTSKTNIATKDAEEKDQPIERSVETSSDNNTSKNRIFENENDDLLHTPHPAQSTLNPSGKPVSRITQFSFRKNVQTTNESSISITPNHSRISSEKIVPELVKEVRQNEDNLKSPSESDVSDNPLLTRELNNIPYEENNSKSEEVHATLEDLIERSNENGPDIDHNECTIDNAAWSIAMKNMDNFKEEMLVKEKKYKDMLQKLDRKKVATDAKLSRQIAQREAEIKKKKKKPIDKAYYVNGKVYKQPKLPMPMKWVTPKLYRYLWKCMEPKFQDNTRVESEKLITKMSNVYKIINRRKKYNNYKAELHDLMETMAKLNIIESRYDFYRFCSDFMPYDFRFKVTPLTLPGNVNNIPYNPELVNKYILKQKSPESDFNDTSSSTS